MSKKTLEDVILSYFIGFVLSCFLLAIGGLFALLLFGNQELSIEETRFTVFLVLFGTVVLGTLLLWRK